MSEDSWDAIRQQVYERAKGCCEYCLTSELNNGQTMQVDHIDPHGGDGSDNLCLSCWNCNNHKRQATHAPDPETGDEVPLFNPRIQLWSEHFQWNTDATYILGLTATRRASITRLKMNRPAMVIARKRWFEGGYHPPTEQGE